MNLDDHGRPLPDFKQPGAVSQVIGALDELDGMFAGRVQDQVQNPAASYLALIITAPDLKIRSRFLGRESRGPAGNDNDLVAA